MQIPGGGIEPPEVARDRSWPRALRPFQFGQYRILILALTLSMLGGGMWVIAVFWQLAEIGASEYDYALILTVGTVGMLTFALLGGAVADRVSRRLILLLCEGIKGTVGVALAVLSFTGSLQLWHLVVAGLALNVSDAFFYPAYPAILPSLLPPQQLLAANGVEGILRPALTTAVGPAAAAALVAWHSPAMSLLVLAAAQVMAAFCLSLMRPIPLERDLTHTQDRHAVINALVDIRDGFRFLFKTRWLLWTLLFACLMTIFVMGPIEVLLPFRIKDGLGGDAGDHALVLAVFGAGGVTGALVTASRRFPKRYLTLMILLWGAGCLPLAVFGFMDQLWLVTVGAFIVGYAFQAATVIWGTLLQRRVPSDMLGRVSSLDFFVSLAFMPVSMALAVPVMHLLGLQLTFLIAGTAPLVLAFVALIAGRLPADERAHPLDETCVTAPIDAVGSGDSVDSTLSDGAPQ